MKDKISEILDKVIKKGNSKDPEDVLREIEEHENLRNELSWRLRRDEIHEEMAGRFLEKFIFSKKHKTIPPELIDLIKSAGPEITEIWGAIKKKVKVTGNDPERDGKMMDAALARYHDSRGVFKLIIKKDLEESNIYATHSSQGKRDFEEALLVRIAERHGYYNFGGRLLRKILKETSDQN